MKKGTPLHRNRGRRLHWVAVLGGLDWAGSCDSRDHARKPAHSRKRPSLRNYAALFCRVS